jgi:hypothetical protein
MCHFDLDKFAGMPIGMCWLKKGTPLILTTVQGAGLLTETNEHVADWCVL